MPFIDDGGVLKVFGRIQLSELAYESKHPVILPRCHCSWLLVKFVHIFKKHACVEVMITYVRKDYEVFSLRLIAKFVKKFSFVCKKCDVRAYNETPMPLQRL